MDDPVNSETRRVDYSCLKGLLAVEIKSLEDNATERMGNLTEELSERDDWPVFLGSAPIESFIKQLDKPEEIRRRVSDRLGRAIKNHIHKANKQLEAHSKSVRRTNLVRIVHLINEDHEIYDPNSVAYIVQNLLRKSSGTGFQYCYVDAVIFHSERHYVPYNNQIAFPILCIEGPSIEQHPWKRSVIDLVMRRWGEWNGESVHFVDNPSVKFDTIEHVPDSMKRQQKWELDYRRNRYMERFTHEQLRNRFDEIIAVADLAFTHGSPQKPVEQAVIWCMSSMSHIMIEMGLRGTPITEFPADPVRLGQAAKRLGFSDDVIQWFERGKG